MEIHTLETKLAAIKMVQEEGRSHGYVARELGVGKVTVQRWQQYIRNQLQEDLANDNVSTKEYVDPLSKEKD